MKQSLQLKLSQHLALTPQLQQSIRLLQLSTLEFNQEIERYLADNPLLEREDGDSTGFSYEGAQTSAEAPPPAEEAVSHESTRDGADLESNALSEWGADGGGSHARGDDEDADYQEFQAATTSLREHLTAQLGLSQLGQRDRALVRLLIESLDDDGYLSQDLEELAAMLPAEMEVDIEELRIALRYLQNFDPPGIAAQCPRECLCLQLRGLAVTPARDLAIDIVQDQLESLAVRDFGRIRRALNCSDEALRDAHQLILSLDPRPGARYAPDDVRYIVPDVIVRKLRGQWIALLNPDAMPRLRINRLYADLLAGQRGSGMTGQLQEAKWLIKNVQQRFDTILRVAQAIVDRQRQFFDFGEVAMRPLTLREIAELLELHESTISRVTTQKYIATPRGIYELKFFFGSHVATDAGGAASSTAIRALIKQLVSAEDPKRPLSDAKIAEVLGQQGIVVARRTIAKYRELLNIPPVNLRKSI
ncbi:MAG: RNA polymerase factor sigma-54 [Rhodocyclaceae bacterium]|nr:RNA polymerase factor sigma-54 [Rhodocyclaceae bacterium]MBX3668731.1 RNA polymerase factor sigma-54 [Rhodocyclaceae bacterium]